MLARVPSSESGPLKRRRFKTFTGCWTCRARRVKCDETQPNCKRCSDSSRICEGYEVRLSWKGDSDQTPGQQSNASTLSRSLMGPSSISIGAGFSEARVHGFINACESAGAMKETQSFGPFSVFSLQRPRSPQRRDPSPSRTATRSWNQERRNADAHATLSESPATAASLGGIYPSSVSPEQNQDCQAAIQLLTPRPSDVEVEASYETTVHSTSNPLYSPTHYREVGQDNHEPDAAPFATERFQSDDLQNFDAFTEQTESVSGDALRTSRVYPSGYTLPEWVDGSTEHPRHLDKLVDPKCVRRLIHHWVFFLSKNMVPVDSVHNLYRTIYLPFAIEGLYFSSKEYNGKVALFHGMCAVAAESLLYLGQATGDITSLLAARHDRLALKHLQGSIRTLRVENLDSTLAAILICVMRDTVGGYPRNWRSHVQGALKCLDEPSRMGLSAGSNLHVVLEQFLGLAVLGNISTTYNIQALLSQLPEEKNYLTRQHGIVKRFLETVHLINKLSSDYHSLDPAAIDKLELQVYMSTPSSKPNDIYDNPVKATVAKHYSHVFYYALLIHFQRMLRRPAAADLHDLVSTGLSHLESAEDIANGTNGQVWLWPCLVIAAECCDGELQNRILKWFRAKERHGFGNNDASSKMCVSYWRWREEHPREALGVSWQSFAQGTDFDVVPL